VTEAAFDGDILVLRHPAWRRLADRAAAIVAQHLGDDPLTAHDRMDRVGYLDAVRAVRDAVKADPAIRAAFREGLGAAGLDPAGTWRDRLILRAQPPRRRHPARETLPLPAHRDCWGSGIPQQLNWWMPVLPVDRERTLWLYPSLFRRPVANNSAAWDFGAVLADVKAGRAGVTTPVATEAPDDALAAPLLLDPGEMAVFSGAQLHRSAPNAGALARFSFETRTVSLDHVRRGLGAPDVDGAGHGPHWRWFRHVDSGARLDRRMRGGM
jgi:hypothetical protein